MLIVFVVMLTHLDYNHVACVIIIPHIIIERNVAIQFPCLIGCSSYISSHRCYYNVVLGL